MTVCLTVLRAHQTSGYARTGSDALEPFRVKTTENLCHHEHRHLVHH